LNEWDIGRVIVGARSLLDLAIDQIKLFSKLQHFATFKVARNNDCAVIWCIPSLVKLFDIG